MSLINSAATMVWSSSTPAAAAAAAAAAASFEPPGPHQQQGNHDGLPQIMSLVFPHHHPSSILTAAAVIVCVVVVVVVVWAAAAAAAAAAVAHVRLLAVAAAPSSSSSSSPAGTNVITNIYTTTIHQQGQQTPPRAEEGEKPSSGARWLKQAAAVVLVVVVIAAALCAASSTYWILGSSNPSISSGGRVHQQQQQQQHRHQPAGEAATTMITPPMIAGGQTPFVFDDDVIVPADKARQLGRLLRTFDGMGPRVDELRVALARATWEEDEEARGVRRLDGWELQQWVSELVRMDDDGDDDWWQRHVQQATFLFQTRLAAEMTWQLDCNNNDDKNNNNKQQQWYATASPSCIQATASLVSQVRDQILAPVDARVHKLVGSVMTLAAAVDKEGERVADTLKCVVRHLNEQLPYPGATAAAGPHDMMDGFRAQFLGSPDVGELGLVESRLAALLRALRGLEQACRWYLDKVEQTQRELQQRMAARRLLLLQGYSELPSLSDVLDVLHGTCVLTSALAIPNPVRPLI
ncbi:hypothetical protein BKA81DRAFT_436896 [Phyllosticta paracitricarpa]